MPRRKARGITLIELLIVVVIVGILAAFAYPNYRQYVTKSKRNEAKAALLQIAIHQERHYLTRSLYTDALATLGINDSVTDSGSYRIAITSASSNEFTAVATYIGSDATEAGKCATFAINSTGAKTSAPNGDCWTSTR